MGKGGEGSKDTITCAYLMQGTVNEMMETNEEEDY